MVHAVEAKKTKCAGVVIKQKLVGSFQDTPQYRVDIINKTCRKHCYPAHVLLTCNSFNTTTEPDPTVIQPIGNGEDCSINYGHPILHPLSFKYTSFTGQNPLTLKSWSLACKGMRKLVNV